VILPARIESSSSVESFIGKIRDELLNGEILDTLDEVEVLV
jgi:hypothetical protein